MGGPLVTCPSCGSLILLVEKGRELYDQRIAEAEKATGKKVVGIMVGEPGTQPATVADSEGSYTCPTCLASHIYLPGPPQPGTN
jgi:hypothetical protein